mmetsp:Transcript_46002/g.133302  ORF Transcript_46002/g.133302 Transcript_46002/m.133302 type:complete len:430 (+) Transcript_46002:327-1616(+)
MAERCPCCSCIVVASFVASASEKSSQGIVHSICNEETFGYKLSGTKQVGKRSRALHAPLYLMACSSHCRVHARTSFEKLEECNSPLVKPEARLRREPQRAQPVPDLQKRRRGAQVVLARDPEGRPLVKREVEVHGEEQAQLPDPVAAPEGRAGVVREPQRAEHEAVLRQGEALALAGHAHVRVLGEVQAEDPARRVAQLALRGPQLPAALLAAAPGAAPAPVLEVGVGRARGPRLGRQGRRLQAVAGQQQVAEAAAVVPARRRGLVLLALAREQPEPRRQRPRVGRRLTSASPGLRGAGRGGAGDEELPEAEGGPVHQHPAASAVLLLVNLDPLTLLVRLHVAGRGHDRACLHHPECPCLGCRSRATPDPGLVYHAPTLEAARHAYNARSVTHWVSGSCTTLALTDKTLRAPESTLPVFSGPQKLFPEV